MGFFDKSSATTEKKSTVVNNAEPLIMKYPKPKILLIDLPKRASDVLLEMGFNVNTGSFGKPYKVQKSSSFLPLIGLGTLPNYTEQEIIVVDLKYGELAKEPTEVKHTPYEENDIWAKCDKGFIDPRPRSANDVMNAFDRAYSIGGVFVVFADAKTNIEMIIARQDPRYGFQQAVEFPDVWSFISELAGMEVKPDHGYEMFASEDKSALTKLVSDHLDGGEFSCTLKESYFSKVDWTPVVKNKFGQVVGLYSCMGIEGSIIVLPQLANKEEFLAKLFTNVLPEIAPHLFPSIEKGKWTHLPEYELARVIELKAEQDKVEQRAKAEIASLETELENERAKNGWIHDLLTETGDQLVEAVQKALDEIGFQKVVDVDSERDKEGKSRREDLQIHDQSPLLIVDVKGIGGYPSDEDALQAGKHAMIRIREMDRTDINGLSIINHQRHLPPLDRENMMPFRQELIDAAMEHVLGLMTSWDLYRLVINRRKLGWNSDEVKSIFYASGRVEVIPQHYQYIGGVAKAWSDKFGVILEDGELKVGDRIAIEFPIEFEEAPVDSIFVNNKAVQQANIGDQTGVLWPAGKSKLREGL
ncbi:MAG: hypothetical protein ACLQHK_08055, partial [Gallionellaceae bacterium]